MKILTVDIGTGTQDILLYDSQLNPENYFKLIVPSPTIIINRQLREATRNQQAVLLHGGIMGGGPSQWAVEAHIRAGLALYATAQAARTFNDDLDIIKSMGIILVSDDEAARMGDTVRRFELRDFDFKSIARAFENFGISLLSLGAIAVAVFDHGDSLPNYSDRQFRFDYLNARIRQHNRLSAFAYRAEQIPPMLTRLLAVAESARGLDVPLMVMDTAPAAILGATFDPCVASESRCIIVNVGNFHTLAFRLGDGVIEGVFEHHTGLLDQGKLEGLLEALSAGTLQHKDIFDDHGHGALVYNATPLSLNSTSFGVAVTGPRRNMLRNSRLRPHFATPFGDMMTCGCYGLLAATAEVIPEFTDPIMASLRGDHDTAPWDINW